jgi:hypothetical protein
MSVSAPAAEKANGLSTVVNVITAPVEAFETLRVAPMWGWAFIIAVVLTAVGQYLAMPAVVHAMQATWPAQVAADPRLATLSAAQQQNALNMATAVIKFSWLFSPVILLIDALVFTIIMLIFKAIGRGSAGFKQLWCAAMNVSVISVGIASLLSGVIAVVRGASNYNTMADAYKAIPSLAWIVPVTGAKAAAFLAGFNAISIWGAVVLAVAMMYVAKTSKVNGAICAFVVLCASSALLAWGAR